MPHPNHFQREGNFNFYQCNTPRVAALTKMVLEREKITYEKEIKSSKIQFEERYHVDMIRDNHWLENKAFLLELEVLNDPMLKATFEHEVSIRQSHFDDLS